MGLILPYKEKIARSAGCYITKDGEFILTHGSHPKYTFDNFSNCENHFNEYFDQFDDYDALPRFPVQVKNWDRLRTIGRQVIESAYPIPNERFFNWILMEWPITELKSLVYNIRTGQFDYAEFDKEQYEINKALNEEYGTQIKRLVLEVPKNERHLYFK